MDDSIPLLNDVCRWNCPDRWCCSTKYFPPPPLCEKEVSLIWKTTGGARFFDKNGPYYNLKVKKNGYCYFFDESLRRCEIYDIRPVDCRIFPFDIFFSSRVQGGLWLVWDCPISERLDEKTIETALTFFEKTYAREFIETWYYERDSADPHFPDGFRAIRKAMLGPAVETYVAKKHLKPRI